MSLLKLARLQESDPHERDVEVLRKRLDEMGYLYFRGALDTAKARKVARDSTKLLKRYALVDEVTTAAPTYSSSRQPDPALMEQDGPMFVKMYSLESFRDLRDSKELLGILRRIHGGPVRMWTQYNFRLNYPSSTADYGPAGKASVHQDYWFHRGSDDFYTCWVPLVEIDDEMGGVALAPRTQKDGLLPNIYKDGKLLGINESQLQGMSWAHADYKPGDFLIFRSTLVHRSPPNRSKAIRLSVDFRYSPAGAKRDWASNYRNPYIVAFVKKAMSLAKEAGATGAVYDRLVQKMVWEGDLKGEARNLTLRNAKRLMSETAR